MVSLKQGDWIEHHRDLPLCSARTMWEARSRTEWETEKLFHQVSTMSVELSHFGSLIDAHRGVGPRAGDDLLNMWDANTDKLGILMNIAVGLI